MAKRRRTHIPAAIKSIQCDACASALLGRQTDDSLYYQPVKTCWRIRNIEDGIKNPAATWRYPPQSSPGVAFRLSANCYQRGELPCVLLLAFFIQNLGAGRNSRALNHPVSVLLVLLVP